MTQGQIDNAGEGYRCPNCRELLDGWTAMEEGTKPEPGNALSVCGYCAAALEFLENGFAMLTPARFRALPLDTQAALIRAGIIARAVREGMAAAERVDPLMAPKVGPKN